MKSIALPLFLLGALLNDPRANAETIFIWQSFLPDDYVTGIMDLTGAVSAVGGGLVFDAKANKGSGAITPYSFTPPTSHPLSLDGGAVPIPVTTQHGGQIQGHFSTPNTFVPTDIWLNATDLLRGETVSFATNTIHLLTNSTVPLLKDVTVDLTGDLAQLYFEQAGNAIIDPFDASTGAFVIPGKLTGGLNNMSAYALGIFDLHIAKALQVTANTMLSGTYAMSGTGNHRHIDLLGSQLVSVPATAYTAFVADLVVPAQLTVSATVDLLGSVNLSLYYYSSADFVVPEPGSITSLIIGLVFLIPMTARRG